MRGIYGQRQSDVQMVRVKIPFGGLTSDQLDTLGRIARDYTPLDKGHVTTRENIQFHFVPLEHAPEIMRQLGEVGLTTREACGNAVRNVTGSPYAGVSKDELFDPTPYAGAFARYFVRKPFTQNPSVSVATESGEMVMDSVVVSIQSAPTVGTGQTQRHNLELGALSPCGSEEGRADGEASWRSKAP